MLYNDKNKLRPEFHIILNFILDYCRIKKVPMTINETLRENIVQNAYYAQGRYTINTVNALRNDAHLWPITESENKNIVTNVQNVSQTAGHGAGLAADILPGGDWSAGPEKWAVIGQAVESASVYFQEFLKERKLKIVWGGSWLNLKDTPHIELQS